MAVTAYSLAKNCILHLTVNTRISRFVHTCSASTALVQSVAVRQLTQETRCVSKDFSKAAAVVTLKEVPLLASCSKVSQKILFLGESYHFPSEMNLARFLRVHPATLIPVYLPMDFATREKKIKEQHLIAKTFANIKALSKTDISNKLEASGIAPGFYLEALQDCAKSSLWLFTPPPEDREKLRTLGLNVADETAKMTQKNLKKLGYKPESDFCSG